MTEATLAEWHPLGTLDEFSEDEPAARVAGQKPIAVFRIGDELFAMHDLCSHATRGCPKAMWRTAASNARCTRG